MFNNGVNSSSGDIRLNGLNIPNQNPNIFAPSDNIPQADYNSYAQKDTLSEKLTRFANNAIVKVTGNVDNVIDRINLNPDESMRSLQLRDLYMEVLDDNDFVSAAKIINATPSPLFRNSMFKSLVQELASNGNFNAALNIVNNYPDPRVKQEMREFLADYANNFAGDSSLAAKIEGNESFYNVVAFKTENIVGSIGKFFGETFDSASSIVSSPTRANALSRGAEKIVGKQYRQASLDYGNLACAYAVSQMLKTVPGLQNVGSAECNELARQLEKNGFTKAYSNGYKPLQSNVQYKAGDVVFFTRKNKNGYGHVGVVSEVVNGVPYMVHNSSSKREVVKVRLDQYYKAPVAVFRMNK